MNQAIKDKWVKALTSGKYSQAIGGLKSSNGGFCCLGVLCDLAIGSREVPCRWKGLALEIYDKQDTANILAHDGGFLPGAVQEWAGLKDSDPLVTTKNGDLMKLSYLNDNGTSFEEIAELIEESL